MELSWGLCPAALAHGVHCPSILVSVLPSFWDTCFLGAVVLGVVVWGGQWILVVVGFALSAVAVGVQPCALGCQGGQ